MRPTPSTTLFLLALLSAAPAAPSPIVTDNCIQSIWSKGYPAAFAMIYETSTAVVLATATVQPATTLYTTSYATVSEQITSYTTHTVLAHNVKRAPNAASASAASAAAEKAKKLKEYCSKHPKDKQCRKTTTTTSTTSACSKISVGIGIGPGAIKNDFVEPVMPTITLTELVVQTSTEVVATQTAPVQTTTEVVLTTTTVSFMAMATTTATITEPASVSAALTATATITEPVAPAATGTSSVEDCTTGNQALLQIMSSSSVFALPADPSTSLDVADYYIRYTAPDGTTQISSYTVTAELNGVNFLNEVRGFCGDYPLECQAATVYSGTEVLKLNVYRNGSNVLNVGDTITQRIGYNEADGIEIACIKATTIFS